MWHLWHHKKDKVAPKPKGPSWFEVGTKALKDFRKVGEKFNYLGIEMIVTRHMGFSTGFPFPVPTPELQAEYRDNNGILRKISFSPHKLECLIAENS